MQKKGISNLKKLIHKNKLHPDLFDHLEICESEKQRRRAKYDSFMSKIEETENEILEMQNGSNGCKFEDSDTAWNRLKKLFVNKEKKIVKQLQIEYKSSNNNDVNLQ